MVELAKSTPRISLPAQIEKLQELNRKADAFGKVPDCMRFVHYDLKEATSFSVSAFMAF